LRRGPQDFVDAERRAMAGVANVYRATYSVLVGITVEQRRR